MTISAGYAANTYNGNGVTTSFAISFQFLSDSTNIKVSLKDTTTGVITEQTVTTHYTVTGANVIFVTAPATGKTVIIELDEPGLRQEADYTEYDTFPASTHEEALDKLCLQAQLLDAKVGAALRFDASVSGVDTVVPDPAGHANEILVVNEDEDAFEYRTATDMDTVTLGAGVETFLGTPSSANLAAAVTDETGSGALVLANTPTLVTPILGTPTSGTLTNCTGLPISTGVSGLGSGIATFLATPTQANLVTAGGNTFKGWEQIGTATASASATIDFTSVITTSYMSLLLVIDSLTPATDNTNVLLTVSINNGSTYVAGTNYSYAGHSYNLAGASTAATNGNGQASYMINAGDGLDNAAAAFCAQVIFNNPANGRNLIQSKCSYVEDTASSNVVNSLTGVITPGGTVNAIRIAMSSGNITSGTFTLYGLRV